MFWVFAAAVMWTLIHGTLTKMGINRPMLHHLILQSKEFQLLSFVIEVI